MKVYSIFLPGMCVLLLTTLLTAQSQLGAGAVSGVIEDTAGKSFAAGAKSPAQPER